MSKEQFLKENLREGEVYAGLVLGRNGEPDYHLVLLPAKTKILTWDKAIEWAKAQGGNLPTLQEQAILYGNLKHEFESSWYWSCEQHVGYSDYAWVRGFISGGQTTEHKPNELRARAVRRIELR